MSYHKKQNTEQQSYHHKKWQLRERDEKNTSAAKTGSRKTHYVKRAS